MGGQKEYDMLDSRGNMTHMAGAEKDGNELERSTGARACLEDLTMEFGLKPKA